MSGGVGGRFCEDAVQDFLEVGQVVDGGSGGSKLGYCVASPVPADVGPGLNVPVVAFGVVGDLAIDARSELKLGKRHAETPLDSRSLHHSGFTDQPASSSHRKLT